MLQMLDEAHLTCVCAFVEILQSLQCNILHNTFLRQCQYSNVFMRLVSICHDTGEWLEYGHESTACGGNRATIHYSFNRCRSLQELIDFLPFFPSKMFAICIICQRHPMTKMPTVVMEMCGDTGGALHDGGGYYGGAFHGGGR